MKANRLKSAATSLEGRRIVVAGDMVLDEFVYGHTDRVSREAPVLILKYDRRVTVPGGAANAVSNVRALGGKPWPVGVIGNDEAGRSLIQMFREHGVETSGLVVEPKVPTIAKTRIMGGGYHTTRQQLIRIDKEHGEDYSPATRQRLNAELKRAIGESDGVLLSDYGYGVLADPTRKLALAEIKRTGKPAVVDSRYRLGLFGSVDRHPERGGGRPSRRDVLENGHEADILKCGAALAEK